MAPLLSSVIRRLVVLGALVVRHGEALHSVTVAGATDEALAATGAAHAAHAAAGASARAGPGSSQVAHLAPELSPTLIKFSGGAVSNSSKPEAAAKEILPGKGQGPNTQAFLKAFFVVSIAELFDKTWFMSLILALKMGWAIALTGGYTGLLLHCVLSALLGFGFSKILKPSALHFITAGLFFLFTLLYGKDWYYAEADSDLIASGTEEASEAMGDETPESEAGKGAEKKGKSAKSTRTLLFQSFLAVFIAEWGDRTQMAMIGLHSSMPVIPVFAGSALAFLALTVSAVAVASFIAKAKLSEKLVMGFASLSFLVFAVLALLDGLKAKQHGE